VDQQPIGTSIPDHLASRIAGTGKNSDVAPSLSGRSSALDHSVLDFIVALVTTASEDNHTSSGSSRTEGESARFLSISANGTDQY
jgi:hypothetical protein